MFINLHTHDCKGSIRDAIAKPKDIVARVKELGQTAYAITNHGSTSSLLTHYKLAKKAGIKFIFGLEAYLTDNILVKERGDYRHICLFAKNITGYKNILKLADISYNKGLYYKPRIDFSLLVEHKEGLIVSSACLGGILALRNEQGKFDKAKIEKELLKYHNEFNEDFFVEIHIYSDKEQIEYNEILYELCIKHNIQHFIACDSHYVRKEDAWVHRHWNNIDENDENGYYQTDDFFLHSEQEVYQKLDWYLPYEFVEQGIQNTVVIADRCNVELKFGEDNFPVYKCVDQVETVKAICREGWRDKIIPYIPSEERQQYLDRFLEEMEILTKANYLNMMLITWDYMQWGKENGIRFGTGRGSVGASLVAYLMGLTQVDPIKNNLTFSRFCNLFRVTTADRIICPLLWKHSIAKFVNCETRRCA